MRSETHWRSVTFKDTGEAAGGHMYWLPKILQTNICTNGVCICWKQLCLRVLWGPQVWDMATVQELTNIPHINMRDITIPKSWFFLTWSNYLGHHDLCCKYCITFSHSRLEIYTIITFQYMLETQGSFDVITAVLTLYIKFFMITFTQKGQAIKACLVFILLQSRIAKVMETFQLEFFNFQMQCLQHFTYTAAAVKSCNCWHWVDTCPTRNNAIIHSLTSIIYIYIYINCKNGKIILQKLYVKY